jgi:hypothetical protein
MFYARFKSLMKSVLPEKVVTTIQSARNKLQPKRNKLLEIARNKLQARSTKLKCRSMSGVRVNVGCGPNPTIGWVNLDVSRHPGVMYWDCTKGLLLNDGTRNISLNILTTNLRRSISLESVCGV